MSTTAEQVQWFSPAGFNKHLTERKKTKMEIKNEIPFVRFIKNKIANVKIKDQVGPVTSHYYRSYVYNKIPSKKFLFFSFYKKIGEMSIHNDIFYVEKEYWNKYQTHWIDLIKRWEQETCRNLQVIINV